MSVLLPEHFYCQTVSVIWSSEAVVQTAEKSKMECTIKWTERGKQYFNLTIA